LLLSEDVVQQTLFACRIHLIYDVPTGDYVDHRYELRLVGAVGAYGDHAHFVLKLFASYPSEWANDQVCAGLVKNRCFHFVVFKVGNLEVEDDGFEPPT
jgi:hypothetical protein